jgi:hypothetical protein
MKYVIKRTDQGGGYVGPPGSANTYVKDKYRAQRFDSEESADRNRCPDNEIVVPMPDLI